MPSVPLTSIAGSGVRAWVSGATYAVGERAISLSNFQIYTRKIAGAGATDPASDSTNWGQISQPIKSIQRGSIVVVSGSGSNTATITSVNTSKSIISLLGWQGDSTRGARLELTNSTTVTASAQTGTGNQTIGYQVVEYY